MLFVKQISVTPSFSSVARRVSTSQHSTGADFCGVFLHGSGAVGLCRAAPSTSQVRARSHHRGNSYGKRMKTSGQDEDDEGKNGKNTENVKMAKTKYMKAFRWNLEWDWGFFGKKIAI